MKWQLQNWKDEFLKNLDGQITLRCVTIAIWVNGNIAPLKISSVNALTENLIRSALRSQTDKKTLITANRIIVIIKAKFHEFLKNFLLPIC